MSRKLRAPKFAVWQNEDSTTATTSLESGVKQLDTITYEITVEATVNGTLEVEGSIDDDITSVKTWTPLAFSAPIVLNGAVSTADQILIQENTFTFLRLKFTNNTGTGNITAYVAGVSKGA